MNTGRILFILTSHKTLGDAGKPTGFWLEELAAPYYTFKDAGYDITLASIAGGLAPIDPRSQKPLGENPPSVDRFLQDETAMAALKNTLSIDSIDSSTYAAVFLPGGHGTMWDLPESKRLADIVSETLQDNRVVAAVCHGPAGLVSALTKTGEPVVKGRKVSAFTDVEEAAVGLTNDVPFLLESKLRELGAIIEKAPNFEAYAVADGNLITGQNPASSEKVAELVIHHLQK